MLVLSRHRNEKIVLDGGRIVLTVVEIRGDKVRLGFDADKSVSIHRGEVQEAIDRNLNEGVQDVV